MPDVTFIGEPAQAPPGMPLFEPGEQRTVSDEEAAVLLRNVNYRLSSGASAVHTPSAAAGAPNAKRQTPNATE